MIVGQMSLAEPSISQIVSAGHTKKPPPKRTATAVTDRKLLPEPR